MRSRFAGVIVLSITTLFAQIAHALNLEDLTLYASHASIYLQIDRVDCTTGFASPESGTGFLVSKDGLVLTSAHLFGTAGCLHDIRSISGTYARETGPTDSSPLPMKLTLVGSPNMDRDIAVLKIEGDLSRGMRPIEVCGHAQPKGGEELFAFGYPHGKPLTPLQITFSRNDVVKRFWIVSGLMTVGMSGGPVLNRFGQAVGIIEGGLQNEASLAPVAAVQYVTPMDLVAISLSPQNSFIHCGIHDIQNLKTVDDDISAALGDKVACGFGLINGFKQYFEAGSAKKRIVVKPDPAVSEEAFRAGKWGLYASNFRLAFSVAHSTQFGIKSDKFRADKDVLGCAAASQFWRQTNNNWFFEGENLFVLQDIKRLLGSSGNVVSPKSNDECTNSARYPPLGGLGAVIATTDISMPVSSGGGTTRRVEQHPLLFSQTDDNLYGFFVFYDIDRKIKELEQDVSRGSTSKDRLINIFDSDREASLEGIIGVCSASIGLVTPLDFRRACTAIMGHALFKTGNDAATCLKQ